MSDTKKEHYVPRCYLENFEGTDFKIQVFDKAILQIRSQTKENVAAENYFYDIDFEKMMEELDDKSKEKVREDIKKITGIDDWETIATTILNKKFIEKSYFFTMETSYGPFLKRIVKKSYKGNDWVIKNCKPFSEGEKKGLALMMAIQMLRTKSFREELGEMISKLYQTLAFKFQSTDKIFPKEAFQVEANKDFVKLQHSAMFTDTENILEIADILLNHIWVMRVNKTDVPFYTSDNPIIRIPHKHDKNLSYGGLNSEGIEIAFPISPYLILVLFEKNWFSRHHKDSTFEVIKTEKEVDYYNYGQVINSYRCVYSQKENFELAQVLCKQYPKIREGGNRIIVG
jgi:hypothetical protein